MRIKNRNQQQQDNLFNTYLEDIILPAKGTAGMHTNLPEPDAELKALLDTVKNIQTVSMINPDEEFRAKARYQWRRALAETPVKPCRSSWSWRTATIVPVVTAALMLSAGGVLAASASSLPDDPLYSIKLSTEQIQINMTPDKNARVKLYAMAADRRISEVVAMAQKGDVMLTDKTIQLMESSLNQITTNLMPGDKSPHGESAPSMTLAVATTPTITETQTFGTAGIQAPAATTGTALDPALLRVLAEYARKYPAELDASLDSLPDITRESVLKAINLVYSYQQTLDALDASQASD
jgi:hypothetical protein